MPAGDNASSQPADLEHLLEDIASLDDTPAAEALLDGGDLLAMLVSEADRGVDIAARYPEAYQQLLADPERQRAFVEALEILEAERSGGLLALPEQGVLPQPALQVERLAHQGWRVSWQLGLDRLQEALAWLAPDPAYRLEDNLMEDLAWPILREQVTVRGRAVDVLLEAAQSIETPERLHPSALVAVEPDLQEGGAPALTLQAELEWGDYRATAPVDGQGRAVFPPLDWSGLLDESGRVVTAELRFSLAARHP